MPASKDGGIKGFFTRAGASFLAGGLYAKEKAWTLAKMGGKVGFYVATTSIVVLMPLIFEIMREGQVRVVTACPCLNRGSSLRQMTMLEIADDRDRQIASERAEAAGLLRFAAPGVGISEGGIGSVTCSSKVDVEHCRVWKHVDRAHATLLTFCWLVLP